MSILCVCRYMDLGDLDRAKYSNQDPDIEK